MTEKIKEEIQKVSDRIYEYIYRSIGHTTAMYPVKQILTDFAEMVFKSQWINVNDEVPKEGEEVLTRSIENNHHIFDLAICENHGKHFTWYQSFSSRQLTNITHWQYLHQPSEDAG
jgi:hypothetical protein